MREAHAITNLLYEGWAYLPLNCLGLSKLLQPLVEQLALIDIWHCQYVTTVPYIIPLLALRCLDLRWLHTTRVYVCVVCVCILTSLYVGM